MTADPVAACEAQLGGGGTAEPFDANDPILTPNSLIVVGADQLQFRFPDTDERLVVTGVNDDVTLAGPAKIVVSRRTQPLPCQLASQRCASGAGATATTGVVACVDELLRTRSAVSV